MCRWCLTSRSLLRAQDYCLPVHRLHGGPGRPGSECHPWHHRYQQGRHPWQHDLPHVSWRVWGTYRSYTYVLDMVCACVFQSAVHGGFGTHRPGNRRHQAMRGRLWWRPVWRPSGIRYQMGRLWNVWEGGANCGSPWMSLVTTALSCTCMHAWQQWRLQLSAVLAQQFLYHCFIPPSSFITNNRRSVRRFKAWG